MLFPGLNKTRARAGLAEAAAFQSLHDSLVMADVGVAVADDIIVEARAANGDSPRHKITAVVARRLRVLEASLSVAAHDPFILVVMGANGVGKTTLIAKMCRYFARRDKTVLLAAGDTFRAAAKEQLQQWAQNLGAVDVVAGGGDPAAVAFDAVRAGVARKKNVVLIDTAGRLPSQPRLMDELAKTRRAAAKALPHSPHELLLVLDATGGQNTLTQIQAFSAAVGVTGVAVTKLDGSAKGGFLLALAAKNPKPLRFIGVGENADDIALFNAEEYARSLFMPDTAPGDGWA